MLMLVIFGPGIWNLVAGIALGFYHFPVFSNTIECCGLKVGQHISTYKYITSDSNY